jgi:hypothetical protein
VWSSDDSHPAQNRAESCGGGPELSVSAAEQVGVGALGPGCRQHHQILTMAALEPVFQHRAVDLPQEVRPDLDDEVGAHAEHMAIVCSVMNFAESQTVTHGCNSCLLTVRDDVRGVKQRTVSQSAHRAPCLVGTQDRGAEDGLVEALPGFAPDITTQVLGDRRVAINQTPRHIRVDDELPLLGLLPEQVHGKTGR